MGSVPSTFSGLHDFEQSRIDQTATSGRLTSASWLCSSNVIPQGELRAHGVKALTPMERKGHGSPDF